jgi:hypothetical protein
VSSLSLKSRLPIFDLLASGADLSLASPPFLLVELFSFPPPVFLVPFCQGGEHAPECRQGSLSCYFHLRLSGAHCPQSVLHLCAGSSCRLSSRSKSVGFVCSQCGHVFFYSRLCVDCCRDSFLSYFWAIGLKNSRFSSLTCTPVVILNASIRCSVKCLWGYKLFFDSIYVVDLACYLASTV